MMSDENTNLTCSASSDAMAGIANSTSSESKTGSAGSHSSDAMITITSKITSDDDSTSMTFSAPCRISTLRDRVYVFYNEYLTDGGGPTKCRLSVEADKIMLKKDGEVHTLMIFDPEQSTSCRYQTAFGCNNFTLHTKSVAVSGRLRPRFADSKTVGDTGRIGFATLEYEMWNDDIRMGSYLLSIRIS